MTAREFFKQVLKKIGLGFCLDALRVARKAGYAVFDMFGWIFFGVAIRCARHKTLNASDVRKILIIRLDRIGDLVLSTPAIRAVRQSYPKSRVDLLVNSYTRDLVVNDPNVDQLLVYKESALDKNYDVAIALHPGLMQNFLTFASGAVWRVGYTGWGGSFFLTHPVKDDRARRVRHEVVSALEVVGRVGCVTSDVSLEVSLTPDGDKEAGDFLQKHGLGSGDPFIVMHPGSRQDYIRWHSERFAQVADAIAQEFGVKIILTAGARETQLVERVKSLMEQEAICAARLSLTGIVSLLNRAKLYIGNCTGPMHIASALGVPVVAIIGTMHPLDSYQAWGPWGTPNIVVHKDSDCKNCHPGDCQDFNCMSAITVEDVVQAATKLLRT